MSEVRKSVGYKHRGLLFYIITPLAFAAISLAVLIICVNPIIKKYGALIGFVLPTVENGSGSQDIDLVDGIGNVENPFDKFNSSDGNGDENSDVPPQIEYGEFSYPSIGSRFGYISVENTDVYCDLYLGDGDAQLDLGAGIYFGSYIPGDNGVSLIAGHCATFFSTLGSAALGDHVYITTNYGEYVYEIFDIRIEDVANSTVYENLKKKDNSIILYTCYPFNTLFTVSERYFVYAKYISGPIIDRG